MTEEIITEKPKRKRRLLLMIGGSIIFICICLTIIVAIFPPDEEDLNTASSADTTEISASNPESEEQTITRLPPTLTPLPTDTPEPTATIKPTDSPEPIVLTGSGDSVVNVEKGDYPAIVHITGNSGSRYFGVTSYNSAGEQIDLIVNTTDPYDGVRAIDFLEGDHTVRFQIEAVGEWRIEVLDFLEARILTIPGTISGNGDDVILLDGIPDLATIAGNTESRYFGVIGWGTGGRDLLINETDPYSGTVIVSRDVVFLEIFAEGEWTIEISSP